MKLSAEYRSVARDNLRGNWGNPILVCLMTLAVSALAGFIPIVGSFVSLFLAGPFMVGELIYFTKLHRKENPTIGAMFDNFGANLTNNFLVYILQTIYIVLWMLLFIIPGIIKAYSYTMTMYLKAKNPNLGANEAITLSRQIMDGKKWNFFCLQFSFIGWVLLSTLTFGIGFIFLMPYMKASEVAFYEDAYNSYIENNNIDINNFNKIEEINKEEQ